MDDVMVPGIDAMESYRASKVLKALSEPARLTMVAAVAVAGELPVSSLADLTGQNMSNASHAVGVLQGCGLFTFRADGKERLQRIAPGFLIPPRDRCDMFGLQLGLLRVFFMHPEPPAEETPAAPPKPKKAHKKGGKGNA